MRSTPPSNGLYSAHDAARLPWDADRWPNFRLAEFQCREGARRLPCRACGGDLYYDPDFFDRLQAARTAHARPFRINSAHRCAAAEARVGGAFSEHFRRLAVDIDLRGHDRHALHASLKRAGFRGFGFYQTFLHADMGRKRFWYGGQASKLAWAS